MALLPVAVNTCSKSPEIPFHARHSSRPLLQSAITSVACVLDC